MNKLVPAACLLLTFCPALAKDPAQAMQDMQSVSDTDPNGFKWMIVCIGLLFLVATSLIVATVMYGMKKPRK
ncbi:MAG: hypothetical protein U0103_12180 [Candidatus Obscuribacterales bacterium]|nr:hypothetical protein [Cyanobacteria bacterium SZAS LIN-5]RTL40324.1 MAG: hypothetical protein EKK48_16375 [Candidatus Melainabacteria bacterium]